MKTADRLSDKVLARDKARALRRDPSDAEQKLWQRLRGRRFQNWKFRRQYPVGPYVADFCGVDGPLVIELDGGQHVEAAEKDQARTRFMESVGFVVIRFWNEEVFTEIEAVMERIEQAVNRLSL